MQAAPHTAQTGHQHHRRSTISADDMVDDDPVSTTEPFKDNTVGTMADVGQDETADVGNDVDNHNAESSDYYYVDDEDEGENSSRQVDIPSPD